MRIFNIVFFISIVSFFAGAKEISVTVDGETYQCSSGSSVQCQCKHDGGYTKLFVNGAAVWSDWGTGGNEMLECVKFQGQQAACSGARPSCQCKHDGGYTKLFVNGAAVWSDWGTGGNEMLECVKFQETLPACIQ